MHAFGGDHSARGALNRLVRSLGCARIVPTLSVDSFARRETAQVRWAAINYAMSAAHEAEAIAQTRLNNILVGDSILLATLSVAMSLLWAVQGLRERKVIALHWEIVQARESEIDSQARVNAPIVQLRDTGRTTVGDKAFSLSWVERRISSRALLVLVPAAFFLMSLTLLWPSIQ